MCCNMYLRTVSDLRTGADTGLTCHKKIEPKVKDWLPEMKTPRL